MPDLNPQQLYEIRILVHQRRIIDAIKAYRVITGAGLAEAKSAVEVMFHEDPLGSPPPVPPTVERVAFSEDQVKELLAKRMKIEAVKLYREAHGVGLKEAKDAVDQIEVSLKRERSSMGMSSEPTMNIDPFAEDDGNRRKIVILVVLLMLVLLGVATFFFMKGF